MAINSFPPPPPIPVDPDQSTLLRWCRSIHVWGRCVTQGKTNNVGEVTLSVSTVASVVSNPIVSINSMISLDPTTANAAADCAGQIAETEKHYAVSKAKYRYSDKLQSVVGRLLKKARTRLEEGKKKGCFKLVKKARGKIASRESKAGQR